MPREMKDSGIEWIGEIPEDWEILKAKQIFKQRNSKGNVVEVQLAATQKYGMYPQKLLEGVVQVKEDTDLQQFKTVHKNDYVISLRSFQGGFEMSDYEGVCSPAYQVFYNTRKIEYKYFKYLFKCDGFISKMNSLTVGIREGKNIQYKDFAESFLPVPSLTSQLSLITFLDKKCSEIDAVIEQTKATIEEYKKLKQSVITEAVTKGIRGNRPMKDSGIEWIGEIPSEWSVIRTKFISDSMSKGNGITKEQIVQNGDSPCVRYGEIYSKYNHSFSNCITKTNKSMYTNLQYFSYGDILFACTGELPEEIGKNIVYLGNEDCLAGGDIIVMKHSQNPSFLNYVYNSYGQTQKSLGKTKLKVVHISPTEIANIFVALPSLPEQHQIADFLDKKCSEIDALVTKKEQIVVELEAYKKSLIYEVVTGKREV